MENENSCDEESRNDVGQDPHQTVFIWSLREEERTVIVSSVDVAHQSVIECDICDPDSP